MPVIVSMLRGINVGGHNTVPMEKLRALYESLGLRDIQTYVQSGNVIFRAPERNIGSLHNRIANRIEETFGFRPEVIHRASSALREAVAKNPFADRPDVEPGKLIVVFLTGTPDAEARQKFLDLKVGPEESHIEGREAYIYFPNGMGRSKLTPALIERTLKTSGTGRNWNTVKKLLEIAGKLEASG